MADSGEEDEHMLNTRGNECFMCISPSETGKLLPFSDRTWARFLDYVTKWETLDGPQGTIARNYLAQHSAPIDCDTPTDNKPDRGGFHKVCYAQFTDPQRIERTKKSMRNKENATVSKAFTSEAIDNGETVKGDEEPAEKRLALLTDFDQPSISASSNYVLPNICVLCQKEKTEVYSLTSKRKRENLVRCSTTEAVNLKRAAEDSGNEALLQKLKDQDCVAIKMMFHYSCYRNFTSYLTNPANTETTFEAYTEAFESFSKMVHTRIIKNKEILRLNKLNKLFIEQVMETHGVDAKSYNTRDLKQRLIKKFPPLCFVTPKIRSQGDFVYVNDISSSALVDEETITQEATPTTLHETDSENDIDIPSHHQLKRSTHSDANPDPSCSTADTSNLPESERFVPHILYNFLAWIVGASDELDAEKMIDVSESDHRKLLSISKDIISLACKKRTSNEEQ